MNMPKCLGLSAILIFVFTCVSFAQDEAAQDSVSSGAINPEPVQAAEILTLPPKTVPLVSW